MIAHLLLNLLLIEALLLKHLFELQAFHLQLSLPLMLKNAKIGLSVSLSIQPPAQKRSLTLDKFCKIEQDLMSSSVLNFSSALPLLMWAVLRC